MEKPVLVLPENLINPLSDRLNIWMTFDATQANLAKIENQVARVGDNSTADALPDLANSEKPPVEIYATLQELEIELSNIDKAKTDIQNYSTEIERLKTSIRNRYFVAAGIVVFVLFLLFSIIMRAF